MFRCFKIIIKHSFLSSIIQMSIIEKVDLIFVM